ncbi:BCCT family transporter [Paracoccaceae bacterium GXU_MW_L88]
MSYEDEAEHDIGEDNVDGSLGPFQFDVHNPVFPISAIGVVLFVLYAILFADQATAQFEAMKSFVINSFDWFFLMAGNIFVLFGILLIFTPMGSVRLGGRDAKPDFSYPGWFAMLFAAGMGIGLMFFGVSEPISHFSSSVAEGAGSPESWAPLGGAAGNPELAKELGMAATIYHWGLHPWAMYAIVALALALFSYNLGLPLTLRSAFFPLLGNRVWGWPGHVIDIVAVMATLFGLATSLGFGAEQAIAGMNFLFGIPVNDWSKTILITVVTLIALASVVAGLDAGVQRASFINMVLAFCLLVFVFLVGPTGQLVKDFFNSLGAYAKDFAPLSNPIGRTDDNFRQGWTAFYWAWWISWSPFVGMFIARVSRGRTVREFLICVMLIPSLVCVIWMTVFGGTAINQIVNDGYTAVADASTELRLFEMLAALPLAQLTSGIGIILVLVFFITSSDSGSLVIDTITAGGKTDAPLPQQVFWCIFEGVIAIVLLMGGGLASLQAMAVTTGLPFAMVLLAMCVCIWMGLKEERNKLKAYA